jgi:hypothetical protein
MEVIDVIKPETTHLSKCFLRMWHARHLGDSLPMGKNDEGRSPNVVDKVKCFICNFVKHREVTMQPKFNTLEKHAGKINYNKVFFTLG